MSKMIFLNLPVRDLGAATRFYEAIGCQMNAQFSGPQASSMMWSDTIIFMLLTHDHYSTFTSKPIADAHRESAMLIALSRGSRAEVDAMTEAAAAAGGKADVRERMDMGWMYNRAFADPDGHVFEAVWIDAAAVTTQDATAEGV